MNQCTSGSGRDPVLKNNVESDQGRPPALIDNTFTHVHTCACIPHTYMHMNEHTHTQMGVLRKCVCTQGGLGSTHLPWCCLVFVNPTHLPVLHVFTAIKMSFHGALYIFHFLLLKGKKGNKTKHTVPQKTAGALPNNRENVMPKN